MRPENFGTNVKQAMKVVGMTQKELAEKSFLTQAAVSQIINGQREPSLKSICAILKVLPVTFEGLVK